MRTPPPASAPVESSPVGKVPPFFVQHKRDQVQAFDENIQKKAASLEPEQFLKILNEDDIVFPSEFPGKKEDISIDRFCFLANDIALSIQRKSEHSLVCTIFS